MGLFQRFKKAWNVFANKDPTGWVPQYNPYGIGSYTNPTLHTFFGNSRASASSIFNRIATDISMVTFRHAEIDDNEQYLKTIHSRLNHCLNLESNVDQSGRMLIMDAVINILDYGSVAIVPVDASENIFNSLMDGYAYEEASAYNITALRCAKIIQWYPDSVEVDLYNDITGRHENITLPKKLVAIVENPIYYIINDTASSIGQILSKMSDLNRVDNLDTRSKLDLLIQLPYALNSDFRKDRAKKRKAELIDQLINTPYGIGYIDSTEKVIQLNRSVENNYIEQIKYLTDQMYHRLGWSDAVFNGTANESEMLNYYNRTVYVFCAAIADAINRKWIPREWSNDGLEVQLKEKIVYYRDPFAVAQISDIAEIADKFTRNEILTPNEVRSIIGFRPAEDPRADELRNRNISSSNDQLPDSVTDNSVEDIRYHNK